MSRPSALSSAVRIYPAFNALYYSFYIAGLEGVYGRSRVRYRRGGFPAFGHHGLAFETSSPAARVFVSASDGPGLQPAALAWSDVLGKVNLDASQVPPERAASCLALGPSFPIRVWGPSTSLFRGLVHLARCRGRVDSLREHFANFWRQYAYRLPIDAYEPTPCEPGYVFFASTLWKKEASTNRFRAHFIEACRSLPGIEFEGGFIRRPDVLGFDQLMIDRRYPAAEYLGKVQRSTVVFNTPAVASCHGWKLAEFLALGKAIISTPPVRALPAPLEDGVHVHYVDGSQDEIRRAAERIAGDDDYRRRLEANARAYYLRYLSPTRVVERVFDAARELSS